MGNTVGQDTLWGLVWGHCVAGDTVGQDSLCVGGAESYCTSRDVGTVWV